MGTNRVVGIDVGKEVLGVSAFGEGKTSQPQQMIGRVPAEVDQLAKQLKKAKVELVVMEASGGFERLVLERIHAASSTARSGVSTAPSPLSSKRSRAPRRSLGVCKPCPVSAQ